MHETIISQPITEEERLEKFGTDLVRAHDLAIKGAWEQINPISLPNLFETNPDLGYEYQVTGLQKKIARDEEILESYSHHRKKTLLPSISTNKSDDLKNRLKNKIDKLHAIEENLIESLLKE